MTTGLMARHRLVHRWCDRGWRVVTTGLMARHRLVHRWCDRGWRVVTTGLMARAAVHRPSGRGTKGTDVDVLQAAHIAGWRFVRSDPRARVVMGMDSLQAKNTSLLTGLKQ